MTVHDVSQLPADWCRPATEALASHAMRAANLVGTYLNAIGLSPGKDGKPVHLPLLFLLDLAAVLQLRRWDAAGLSSQLPEDLPSAAEAEETFWHGVSSHPEHFFGLKGLGDGLKARVMRTWILNFAWDAEPFLGAELLVNDAEDDEFVDLLAEFLWNNRHRLNAGNESAGDNE